MVWAAVVRRTSSCFLGVEILVLWTHKCWRPYYTYRKLQCNVMFIAFQGLRSNEISNQLWSHVAEHPDDVVLRSGLCDVGLSVTLFGGL